jgi:Casein kinase II regulatory subunit
LTEEQQEIVESAAEMLYGLIHARYVVAFPNRCWMEHVWNIYQHVSCISSFRHSYIVTNRGMHAMYEKYRLAHFGRCPHVFCQGQPVLPVGLSDLPRNYTVNVFCPRCHGLYFPKSTRQANIDGAYFGTTFPHLYLMTHPVGTFVDRSVWFWSHRRSRPVLLFLLGHCTGQADAELSTARLRISRPRVFALFCASGGRGTEPYLRRTKRIGRGSGPGSCRSPIEEKYTKMIPLICSLSYKRIQFVCGLFYVCLFA